MEAKMYYKTGNLETQLLKVCMQNMNKSTKSISKKGCIHSQTNASNPHKYLGVVGSWSQEEKHAEKQERASAATREIFYKGLGVTPDTTSLAYSIPTKEGMVESMTRADYPNFHVKARDMERVRQAMSDIMHAPAEKQLNLSWEECKEVVNRCEQQCTNRKLCIFIQKDSLYENHK